MRPASVRILVALLSTCGPLLVQAQQREFDLPAADSAAKGTALAEVMRKGQVEGRFRQFNMVTVNDGTPSDPWAVAFGGTLGYASARWHRLQFKLSGGYTFDLTNSGLNEPDPSTGQLSRYELGLYDVTDPRVRNDVAYLQLFQLNYMSPRTSVVFGRQELNTPFLNPQDGRMHPTLFEGVWTVHRLKGGTRIEGGWLYRAAPRSTAGWYGIERSMSLYPSGIGVNGKPSAYATHLRSPGIFIAGVEHTFRDLVKVSAWEQAVPAIFNTALVQAEVARKGRRWGVGLQGIRQDALANDLADSLAYMPACAGTWVLGGRFRMDHGPFRWQLNYTRIAAEGRFLMPREWGREPLYTFLPRERNEGLGDVHAASLNLIWKDLVPGLRLQADAGVYLLPAITDARLNKYAMPSYHQFDLNAQYQFQGAWKGLAAQVLVLAKVPLNDDPLTAKQAYNKVDMLHGELIINYIF
ncbi:MAG: hypothetical protein JNL05_02885 [Flavobacteriales bacterium]|nr:hypothetical protein [Flavobacteriales bacterium]